MSGLVTSAANPVIGVLLSDGEAAFAVIGLALLKLGALMAALTWAWVHFGLGSKFSGAVAKVTGVEFKFRYVRRPRRKYGVFLDAKKVGTPFAGVFGGKEVAMIATPVASFGVEPSGGYLAVDSPSESAVGADMGLPVSDAPGAPAWSFVAGPFGGQAVRGVNYEELGGGSDDLEFQDARMMEGD
jgi:hypothetical protein